MKSLLPRDDLFFDSFEKIGSLNAIGALKLAELLDEPSEAESLSRRIKLIESECDEVVHRTFDHLHRTFVTPLDRQDIIKLLGRYDDVLDYTESASSRIHLFKPRAIPEEARQLAKLLCECTKVLGEMVALIRDLKKHSEHVLELAVEVNRLENEADLVHRSALSRLFGEEEDVRELIKWKDILLHIESAIDRCEDVADIIEGIVLEYS